MIGWNWVQMAIDPKNTAGVVSVFWSGHHKDSISMPVLPDTMKIYVNLYIYRKKNKNILFMQ